MFSYAIISVIIISLLSLVGVFFLGLKTSLLKKITIYLVSLSAGALMGDVFIHLIPEIIEQYTWTIWTSVFVLSGLIFGFVIEKIIHRRHCHIPISSHHIHPFARMNLVGDCIHNFIDGLIIGASYMISIEAGIATTIAIMLHEIPQEIGDFGVLIHGGFSFKKALLLNFLVALTAIFGVLVAFGLQTYVENIDIYLVPFSIGTFIYIAGSDLIPEMHKEVARQKSLIQILTFMLGIAFMFLLLLGE